MTKDEELDQLRQENSALRDQVARLSQRLRELEARLAKDSHNSHLPPSSDRFHRQPKSLRKKSEKQVCAAGQKEKGWRKKMEKYKKFIVPALVFGVFIVIAIPVSLYILSLPLSQITGGGCSGFSGYQLSNCIAFYQRQGGLEVLQLYAQIALWTLWIGLFTGGVCTFFVFPRISLSGTLKGILLFIGLLSALLLASAPLYLFAELISYGFCFALSLIIGCLALEIFLVSPTKLVVATEEPAPSVQQK